MISDERKQDKIQCRLCGKWFIALGVHVWKTHNMKARAYKIKFGYNVGCGIVPEWFSKKMAEKCTPSVVAFLKKRAVHYEKGRKMKTYISKEHMELLKQSKPPINLPGAKHLQKTKDNISAGLKRYHKLVDKALAKYSC